MPVQAASRRCEKRLRCWRRLPAARGAPAESLRPSPRPLPQVGASEATLLSKLGIKPFSYGLVIQQVFDAGSLYDPKVRAGPGNAMLGMLWSLLLHAAWFSECAALCARASVWLGGGPAARGGGSGALHRPFRLHCFSTTPRR